MWVFIMLAMFLVVLGSFFYVTRRISQFRFMEKGIKRQEMASDFRKSGAGSCDVWCTLVYHGNDGCPHMYDPPCHHLAFM